MSAPTLDVVAGRPFPLQRNTGDRRSNQVQFHEVRGGRTIGRDSGGHEEMRYVIESTIVIGDTPISAELTLTDRETMKFRMLLGRTTLKPDYLVDPGRSYLSRRPPQK